MDKFLEHYDQLTGKMDIMEGLTIEIYLFFIK
jgi:hypothetical protein